MKFMCKQLEENKDFITLMIKMVGSNCNMQCIYCYEHVKKRQKVEIIKSEEVIEYIKKFLDYNHIFFLFHGGEPLLADIGEVKKCLDFIKLNFKSEQYKIQFQTNGTLLSLEWMELLKQYEPNISLSISLDPLGKKDMRYSVNFDYRKLVYDNLKKYGEIIPNTGIISVAHRNNIDFFEKFIEELLELNIRSLTINKYIDTINNIDLKLSEQEFVDFLKRIAMIWISKGWYKQINIQPLNALFSKRENRLCIFLPDENKCSYFKTFYSLSNISEFCDHVYQNKKVSLPMKCKICDIYNLCGGGCLVEKKDSTFCNARRNLFQFIEEVKNENRKFSIK